MIKNLFKSIITIFAIGFAVFAITSCSENLGENVDDVCYVTLSTTEKETSRSALPSVSAEDFSYLYLVATEKDSGKKYVYGPWDSVAEMEADAVSISRGQFTFSLFGSSGSAFYKADKDVVIKDKNNRITFNMVYAGYSNYLAGNGNISIKISFPVENFNNVTAGLYKTNGKKVVGYADEELQADAAGNAWYQKNGVKTGNYIVIFKFYADAERTVLLGTYQEYTYVAVNLTSTSDVILDSFVNLRTISYELNNCGSFDANTKVPVNFTRYSGTITLPKPTPISDLFEFQGWYESADFNSTTKVESFDCSTSENRTFYAKWKRNISVSINANGGTFTIDKNGTPQNVTEVQQTFFKGQEQSIYSIDSLKIAPPAGKTHFVGWAKNQTSIVKDYSDGDVVSFDDDVTLYAIYSSTHVIDATTDSDGDGLTDLDEINIYHTDPNSEDTDGDGFTDKEEINLHSETAFDPRIADVPELKITMVGQPSITYTYTTSEGKSDSESVSTSEGYNRSESTSSSHGTSSSMTHGWSFGIKYGAKLGTKIEHSVEVAAGASGSYSSGSSYSYSQSESESYSKSISNGKSYSTSSSKSISGGTVKMWVKLKNTSNLTYSVNNFSVTLYEVSSNGSSTRNAVDTANCVYDSGLEPGCESELIAVKFNLSNPGKVQSLLANSSGFYIAVSGYNITMQKKDSLYSSDFTYELTRVRAKTARVSIDYGVTNTDRKEEVYLVSTKTDYNPDATSIEDEYRNVSLRQVLETIGISESKNNLVVESGMIKSIKGVAVNSENSRLGDWYIALVHKTTDGSYMTMYNDLVDDSSATKTYNIDDIIVSAQDSVHIFYDADEDGDGVPASEEYINGTSDQKVDTDGDGLTDYQELYGFERNGVVYYTNPLNKDTDGDSDYENGFYLDDGDDPNPTDSLLKNIAGLSLLKCGDWNNEFDYSEKVKTVDYIEVKNESGNYVDFTETLLLAAYGKCRGTTILWGYGTDKDTPATVYNEFENEVEIPLKPSLGINYINIKTISPDQSKSKIYTIAVKTKYNDLLNFGGDSKKAGEANVTWNKYTDSRFEGYILHVTKCSQNSTYTPINITKTIISGATSDMVTKESENFLSVDTSTLLQGMKKVTGVGQGLYYNFAIYGYEKSSTTTVNSKFLGSKIIKMTPPSEGTLKIYAHYVQAIEDCDGGYDPDYYWSFYSSPSIDELRNWNVGSKGYEFDDVDQQYYDFNEKRMIYGKYVDPPILSYGRMVSTKLERIDGSVASIGWQCWEYDKSSSDDNLGTKRIYLTYVKDTDTWNVQIDGKIYNEASPAERTQSRGRWRDTYNTGVLQGDGQKQLCYLYTNDSDGKVKVWLTLEWCWE